MLLLSVININWLLNGVLALIMFGLGLSLKKEDFRALFDQPKSLAIGLFAQMVLLPMLAAVMVYSSSLSPEWKVGVMILSVCPGGITSNLVSYFVKGNVALAVSLTVSNALLSLLSIPLMVNLFLTHFMNQGDQSMSLPFWNTLLEIFMVTIIPAWLGMAARLRLGKKVVGVSKWLNVVLPLLLLMVFGFKFIAGPDQGGTAMSGSDILTLTPYVITLNVLSMLLGFAVGIPFALSYRNRITIAVEVGLHNTALALLIAGDKLQNPLMEKPALVYALYSVVVTFTVGYLLVLFREKVLKKSLDLGQNA
ncbi:MAG: bile acid:sodium symporter family protein [Sphingomonadales bacterium]|nr:bile acid:sodium symporter family protein [Sphingomonadales bacterium]